MRLAWHQDKIDQPPGSVADTNNLAAEATPRTTQSLRNAAGAAIESQTHMVSLPGRAPAAFWCARAIVPSIQANASFGSPAATTWAMILSHTPATAQQRKRR